LTADFLQRAGIHVGCMNHSGKLRAQQTAEILATAVLRQGKEPVVMKGMLPQDSVEACIDSLADGGPDRMLVGHLPYMSRLAAFLVIGQVDRQVVNFQTGSVVCLDHDERTGWNIDWMVRPELLTSAAARR